MEARRYTAGGAALPSRDGEDGVNGQHRTRTLLAIDGADVQTGWGTEPAYNGAGGGHAKDDQGHNIPELTAQAISLAGSPDTCTVKLSMSVPATPWVTRMKSQAGNIGSTSQLLPDGKRGGVSFMKPQSEGSDTLVTYGYQISGEVRLAALDFDGDIHIGKSSGGSSFNGFAMREVRFANVKPSDLKTWQLQTRQRKTETVEFRNVSLHRGKVSNVEMAWKKEALPKPVVKPTANKFPRLEFGKVVERTINDDNPELGKFMFDLDTGRFLSMPKQISSQQELMGWLKKNGVDALGEVRQSFKGLYGFDMVAIPTSEDNWEPHSRILSQVDLGKPGSPIPISGHGNLPATYLFKTREGNRGVLQILEIIDNQAVKIRYKLLEVIRTDGPGTKSD